MPVPPLTAAALACARRGWRVFPVRPRAKTPPAITSWEDRASTDPGRIRGCWARGPYNVGIACGPSGLVVIDLDKPKPGEAPPLRWARPGITDGADVLADLCESHGQRWPAETFMVATGRGGTHLYFTAPPGTEIRNSSGDSGRGLGWLIDVRAAGGYALAPGSVVDLPGGATGTYQVIYDRPPAPLPHWLAVLLTRPRGGNAPVECSPAPAAVADPRSYAEAALGSEIARVLRSPDHGHNWALNKAAFSLGRLIGAGVLRRELAEQSLQAAGETAHTHDTPAQIAAVIRSGIDAGLRQPRQVAPRTAA